MWIWWTGISVVTIPLSWVYPFYHLTVLCKETSLLVTCNMLCSSKWLLTIQESCQSVPKAIYTFVSPSENCLNGPKINTCWQLVTLKSAGLLNQQTFTASCVFPVPWAEEQLFVFPIFFPSFYLLPCCAVVKALVLHLYKISHCPSVADLLDTDGWVAVADRLECPICCRQEGILKARQKCGLSISLVLICSWTEEIYTLRYFTYR